MTELAAGDRVFGGALSRAVADYVVIDVAGTIAAAGNALHTPDGVDDRTAVTLAVAGCTAAAALAVVNPGLSDTLLVGGAGGGVGVFVQRALCAGDRDGIGDIGDALRALGADPVAYGGRPDRPSPCSGSCWCLCGDRPPLRDGHGAGGMRARRA